MKYLKEAIAKTPAKYYMAMSTIVGIIYMALNAAIVVWLTDAISGDLNSAGLVILGCVVNTILSILLKIDMSASHAYTYLINKLMEKALYSDYNLFIKYSPDHILTTHSNMKTVSKIVMLCQSIVTSSVSVVINVIGIWYLNSVVIIPILPVFIIMALCVIFGVKSWQKIDDEYDKEKRSRNKEIYDIINGFAEVRSFNSTEETHLSSIIRKNNNLMSILFKRCLRSVFIKLSTESANSISTIILMFISMLYVAKGEITQAAAINTVMYAWRIVQPLSNLIDSASDLSEAAVLLKSYDEVISYENKILDGNIDISFNDKISFSNVSFKYNDSDQVINGVTFDIKKGDHIGICGTSGGGKSTLLKLIPRFYDVDKGGIYIDNVNIKDASKASLKSLIGIVHQDPYIFDGSIMDNLKYASKDADYFSIINACKKASIYDFIMSLEKKFDTYVGPKGLKLSGGQKQRIAIARIFLTNPDIIILDEATSALDTSTERFIQKSLNTIFKDKTMIVVAHRLSTIINSDKILVLDSGVIAEEGSHQELMNTGGIYYNMYNADKEEDILD